MPTARWEAELTREAEGTPGERPPAPEDGGIPGFSPGAEVGRALSHHPPWLYPFRVSSLHCPPWGTEGLLHCSSSVLFALQVLTHHLGHVRELTQLQRVWDGAREAALLTAPPGMLLLMTLVPDTVSRRLGPRVPAEVSPA